MKIKSKGIILKEVPFFMHVTNFLWGVSYLVVIIKLIETCTSYIVSGAVF